MDREMTLEEILGLLRRQSHSQSDKGRSFESLVRAALLADPVQQQRFSDIQRWKEWAADFGARTQDTGIDLVGELAEGGGYAAIQCKFYDPAKTRSISRQGIDSFLTASSREFLDLQDRPFTFAERIIVTTLPDWTSHAEDAISGVRPHVQRLDLNKLGDFKVNWRDLLNPKVNRPEVKKDLRKYQRKAITTVHKAFHNGADRGKLIMACGTGKTLVSLRLAEKQVKAGGWVLHLTPSLSLLSQTLIEWAADSELPLRPFAICSDKQVHRKDEEDILPVDMPLPPTTNAKDLARVLAQEPAPRRRSKAPFTVIFATYQSIDVVHEAQRILRRKNLPCEFELVIADEAHRTAGTDKREWKPGEGGTGTKKTSLFTRIHSNEAVQAKKRLYMTATPKIYGSEIQKKASDEQLAVYSMDDEAVFGKELYRYSFSDAVKEGYLSDYRVVAFCMYSKQVQELLSNFLQERDREDKSIPLPDVVKMLGCWKAVLDPRTQDRSRIHLAAKPLEDDGLEDDGKKAPISLKRVLAFTGTIKGSKQLTNSFGTLLRAADAERPDDLEIEHVDGAMNAPKRNSRLNWLRGEVPEGKCRMISNVRCFGEGIDVPALDGVVFFSPRKSQVDIVQAVGRVMRKTEGKEMGYIILPVAIPPEEKQEDIMGKSKEYKHVWQVLAALRAHDERFEARINQVEFERRLPEQISVILDGEGVRDAEVSQQYLLPEHLKKIGDALRVQLLKRCGNRTYWADWADEVGRIAREVVGEIKKKSRENEAFGKTFHRFLRSLREIINPGIQEEQAMELLAQHWITEPIFDALFKDDSFSTRNSVSRNIDKVFQAMEGTGIGRNLEALQEFYEDVVKRAEGIESLEGRQNIMERLYQDFFKRAFKKDAKKLGIVYTPTEAVDFLLNSAECLVRRHFGKKLTNRGVDVLDPFSGTGRFIVRLLNNRHLVKDKDLQRKYKEELHMNEIMLLPYYIGNVAMEQVYRHRMTDLTGIQDENTTFEKSILTDSFQLYEREQKEFFGNALPYNYERARQQKKRRIWVIVGNPPYSMGQRSANDANQNTHYPRLYESIAREYVARSEATLKRALYDSYILAIRWATDRLKDQTGGDESGVVAFITNSGFIDGKGASGLRKKLPEEYSEIYVLNLRGNVRARGDALIKEGGQIFGQSAQVPTALLILVKKRNNSDMGKIYYHDIGECLSTKEKLAILKKAGSMEGEGISWRELHPNKEGDWLDQRSRDFDKHIPLGNNEVKRAVLKSASLGQGQVALLGESAARDANSLFSVYTQGMKTNRDPWAWNLAEEEVSKNMKRLISFYNRQLQECNGGSRQSAPLTLQQLSGVIDRNPRKIKWSERLLQSLCRGDRARFKAEFIRTAMYRPFCKQSLYYDPFLNERVCRTRHCWPTPASRNPALGLLGNGKSQDFCAWATDLVPEHDLVPGAQWFPLYWWDDKGKKHENITQEALACFRHRLGTGRLSAEDLFHYAYGLLHHPAYRERYSGNLKREMARLPCVEDWRQFVQAGRELLRLHIHYDTVKPYVLKEQGKPPAEVGGPMSIKFAVSQQKAKRDTSTVVVNGWLTLSGIPPAAYLHQVGGKSLPEWVIDRYRLRTDKASGIQNDPAKVSEDPMFLPDLFAKAVRVGVETHRLVSSLPPLKIIEGWY